MNKKTDINSIIGFFLIGLVLMYFFWQDAAVTPTPPIETPAATEQKDMRQGANGEAEELAVTEDAPIDSLQAASLPPVRSIAIENDVVKMHINTRGARVENLRLKNFQTFKRFEQEEEAPLFLAQDRNFRFNLELGNQIETSNLHFEVVEESKKQVKLRARTPKGNVFVTYTLDDKNYQSSMRVTTDFDVTDPTMHWSMRGLRHEKNRDYEQSKTTLYFFLNDKGKTDYLSETRDSRKEKENIGWFAFKQQFFSTIIHPEKNISFIEMENRSIEDSEAFTKDMIASARFRNTGNLDLPIAIYSGPNRFKTLKDFDAGYEKLIPLGWGIFGWINRGVIINIFNWLEGYGINYGIIILLMTLLIKLVLFPLTFGSYKSMAKIRVLKPEIDAINEKYKEKDAMKKQQAVMQLYQQAGVNPLGGCIPVLFQMPILFAVFQFFPASIELRQQSFLWANDLSSYDSIYNLPFNIPFYGDHVSLFTLLMTVTTIMYTYMNQQLTGGNTQYPQLKYVIYLMPVVFLGVFNNFAAGLSYYYFVANLITFGQQFAIRGIIDDEKILARIEENKKKPKKKSKFAQRMEELAKERGQQLPSSKGSGKKKK
ncbi:MAG: membrane protein insertase YidC [Flavobacteriales bacterium]|nr:MAG: membrane protein insertase YidC [Flavobacteriales bacterium]